MSSMAAGPYATIEVGRSETNSLGLVFRETSFKIGFTKSSAAKGFSSDPVRMA